MERRTMNYSIKTYLGRWDFGGGLVVERRDEGFFLKPVGRVAIELMFLYMLVLVGVPGIGAFTSHGLYAAVAAVRDSGDLLAVLRGDIGFAGVAALYCLFLVLFPVWALFFRAKPMILFSLRDYTVIFGRFYHYHLRHVWRRIPFEKVREVEILTTKELIRGSSLAVQGRGQAKKTRYWLSIVTDEEDPLYIIELPRLDEMSSNMYLVAEVCKLPLVYETFPKERRER